MKPQLSPSIGRSMVHVNALGQAVWLPKPVEELLGRICVEQSLLPPDPGVRRALAGLGEAAALDVLMQMQGRTIRNISGFILHMVNNFRPVPTQESVALSSGSAVCSGNGFLLLVAEQNSFTIIHIL